MIRFTLFFVLPELGFRFVITTNVINSFMNNDNKKCLENLKNEIKLIKIDCGEICRTTSYEEKRIIQGRLI